MAVVEQQKGQQRQIIGRLVPVGIEKAVEVVNHGFGFARAAAAEKD